VDPETGSENGRTEIEDKKPAASRHRTTQTKNHRQKRRIETLTGVETCAQQKKIKTGESARNLGSALSSAVGIRGAEPNQEREHEQGDENCEQKPRLSGKHETAADLGARASKGREQEMKIGRWPLLAQKPQQEQKNSGRG
jgi:hypothetical protein